MVVGTCGVRSRLIINGVGFVVGERFSFQYPLLFFFSINLFEWKVYRKNDLLFHHTTLI